MVLPVPLVLLAPLVLLDRRAIRVRKALLARKVIEDQQVPMVSGVLLVLLVLLAHAAATELRDLSDQRATPVLPDPREGLAHKALLARRVNLENVVLRVNVERPVPLALLVLPVSAAPLVKVRITSGPSR